MDVLLKQIWKKFDETVLTHSSIHHLLAIQELSKRHGYSRAVDISNYLNISRASVSITVNKLKEKGYVAEDPNRFLNLSQKGKTLVNSVLSKRRIVQQFFKEVLNLSPGEAEIEACKVEHLLSEPAGKKLISFMGYFLSEQKQVKAFRKGLDSFNYHCSATTNCAVCEVDCFYKSGQKLT
jgi:DtxR family Mn-dependent transcriptional regulator